MQQKSSTIDTTIRFADIISLTFGVLAIAIGLINTFWGNDTLFGVFILLLSNVFFPAVTAAFTEKTGFSIHKIVKVAIAIFILWAALGVGELFAKVALMMSTFSN